MQETKRVILNKFISIILIIVLTIADFVTIGINFISMASDETKAYDNLQLQAYFKNEDGEKVRERDIDIKSNEKMYVEISVLNEGYLRGCLNFENCNFDVVDAVDNDYISSIEKNKIYLNRINSDKTITLELQIEARTSEKMNIDILNKRAEIKLEGIYTYSNNDQLVEDTISQSTEINVKFVSSKDIKGYVDAQILTNKEYKIGETNKRILQILVNSKIEDSEYPIKTSNIHVALPEGIESVEVVARDTSATNPNIIFGEKNYSFNKEESILEINLENSKDEKNNISFIKNKTDQIVITCVYSKDKVFSTETKVDVSQDIVTFDNKTLEGDKQILVDKEIDGIISYEIEQQEAEIFKGKLYSHEERDYITRVQSYIDTIITGDKVKFVLGDTKYSVEKGKKDSKITYKQIKIKKEDFDNILGEDGFVIVKDEKENVISNITRETQVNEDGSIVIQIPEEKYKLEVETSKPLQVGKLGFEITKSIIENQYNREEIKEFSSIENSIVANGKIQTKHIILKGTQTKADFNIDTNTLNAGEAKNIQLKVTLLADDESKDLYKNPTIKIELPKAVKELKNAQVKYLYLNGLEKESAEITEENGVNFITIKLSGEHQTYMKDATVGTEIIIKMDILMDSLISDSKEYIKLIYTNDNVESIENDGVITQELNVNSNRSVRVLASSGIDMLGGNENENSNETESGNAGSSADSIVAAIEETTNYEKMSKKSAYRFKLRIKNNISEAIENIKINLELSETLEIIPNYNNEINSEGVIDIQRLEAEEEKTIDIYVKCIGKKNKDDKGIIYAKILANGDIYETAKLIYDIDDISAKVTMSSKAANNDAERKVKVGEKIEYEINVENTGVDDLDNLKIISNMSNFLQINKVTIDGVEVEYEDSQNEDDEDNNENLVNAGIYREITIKTDLSESQKKKVIVDTTVGNNYSISSGYDVNCFVELIYKNYILDDAAEIGYNIKEGESTEQNGNAEDRENPSIDGGDNSTDGGNDAENVADNQNTDVPENKDGSFMVTGTVWLDENKNGEKTSASSGIEGIKVKLIDEAGNIIKDKNKNEISAETDKSGKYTLSNIESGQYMVVFEYDTNKYKVSEYKKDGVSESKNSDAILKEITINGTKAVVAVTDILSVNSNISNIDLGLEETNIFDLELTKTVNKITVSNSQGTKEYRLDNKTLAKVEIPSKLLNNTKVTIEYSINVKNVGSIPGYAKSIVDYAPGNTEFDSTINKNWVKQGDYLYNKSLENVEINVGETKELKLVLTKVMNESNTGLVSNSAEITEAESKTGIKDVDSEPNNKKENEDDLGQADVIIGVSTGAIIKYIMLVISIFSIFVIGIYFIKKKVLIIK